MLNNTQRHMLLSVSLLAFDVSRPVFQGSGDRSEKHWWFGGVAVPHHSAHHWIGSFIHRNLISASKNVFSSLGGWNSLLTSDMRPVVDLMSSDS